MGDYIGELLFEHDCVIVPEFGGFVCNYASAKIHAGHSFNPPFKKVSFNKNLRNNDGLLANYISFSEKKDYNFSLKYISQTVSDWNKELSKDGQIDLKNVGVFYLDAEKNLQFEPDYSENYLTDSFGLTTFISPPIKRETITKKTEQEFKDRVVVPSKEKKKAPVRRYKRAIVAASILIPLLLAFSWVSYRTDFFRNTNYSNLNPFSQKETASYRARTEEVKMITPEDLQAEKKSFGESEPYGEILIGKPEKKFVVKLSEADKTLVKTPAEAFDFASKKYFIIGGCFEIPENAERFLNVLQEKGYPAAKLEKLGRLTPVYYSGFASKQEALAELSRIKAADGNAWLLAK